MRFSRELSTANNYFKLVSSFSHRIFAYSSMVALHLSIVAFIDSKISVPAGRRNWVGSIDYHHLAFAERVPLQDDDILALKSCEERGNP